LSLIVEVFEVGSRMAQSIDDDAALAVAELDRKCPVEPVRPKLASGHCIDQLSRDPDAATRLAHASFKHIPNTEFASSRVKVPSSRVPTSFR
jgi:hypothetical protein